jgi:hypothetical protein
MSLRTLTTLSAFCIAFCLFTPSAHAQFDCGEHCIQNPEGGFTGWEEPTMGGFNPPTARTCVAYSWYNQACKTCYTPEPTPSHPNPTPTCGWTQGVGGCSCPANGCANAPTVGACDYV